VRVDQIQARVVLHLGLYLDLLILQVRCFFGSSLVFVRLFFLLETVLKVSNHSIHRAPFEPALLVLVGHRHLTLTIVNSIISL